MKTKVLYTTDFGTRLWIGTDHGFSGSSIQGIHQGRIVSGRCRDLRDSIELKHVRLHDDIVRLATTSQAYSRGFGHSEQLFPISETAFGSLLAADRQIAAAMAARQAAATAERRTAAMAARKAVVAAAVRSRISARRALPVPVPSAAAASVRPQPAIASGADFRNWASQFARMMNSESGQLAMGESGIG